MRQYADRDAQIGAPERWIDEADALPLRPIISLLRTVFVEDVQVRNAGFRFER